MEWRRSVSVISEIPQLSEEGMPSWLPTDRGQMLDREVWVTSDSHDDNAISLGDQYGHSENFCKKTFESILSAGTQLFYQLYIIRMRPFPIYACRKLCQNSSCSTLYAFPRPSEIYTSSNL